MRSCTGVCPALVQSSQVLEFGWGTSPSVKCSQRSSYIFYPPHGVELPFPYHSRPSAGKYDDGPVAGIKFSPKNPITPLENRNLRRADGLCPLFPAWGGAVPLVFPAKFGRPGCFRPGGGPGPGTGPAPSQGRGGLGPLGHPRPGMVQWEAASAEGLPDDNASLAEE